MAITRTCDKCGKAAIGAIHVDVWAEGVADPERPTGVRLSKDSCAKCRPGLMKEMLAEGSAQLERDIPRHVEMLAARKEEAEAQSELDAHDRAASMLPEGPNAQHNEKRTELLKRITVAQTRYHRALQGGDVTVG